MNYPIPYSQNTNEWRNYVLGYTNNLSDEKQQWIDAIKQDFKTNLSYFPVTKNLDMSKTYDAWIYDGNREDKILGNKQFLSYPYDTLQFDIGDYVGFQYGDNYENWLITSIDKSRLWNVTGKIDRCVADLKWVDKDGKVQSYPCVVKEATRVTPDFNKLVITQQGYISVIVQENVDTDLLKINNRFLFGIPNNYTAFRVDLINNFTKTRSITLNMRVDTIAAEDDLVNGIASNNNKITPVPPVSGKQDLITPNVNTIYQGTDNIQTFNVYAYSNSVKQTDIFTVAISGVPSSYYNLTVVDGNTFSIVNNYGMYMDSKLHILCTDTVDNSTVSMDVVLGGDF